MKAVKIYAVIITIILALSLLWLGFELNNIKEQDLYISQVLSDRENVEAELADALAQTEVAEAEANAALEKLSEAYVAPRIYLSSSLAVQGDILQVIAEVNSEDAVPEIETELGLPIFMEEKNRVFTSYVPVGYAQTPGEYEININIGDKRYTETVTVTERSYGEQHMTMSSSTASATVNAANANQDFKEKVSVTYNQADPVRYWDGTFIRPVEGRITTEFGIYRYTTYTEGGSRTTRHTGIDLAIAAGTPVPATNTGKVLVAEPVIITGNTIVIEHGGGLKSYYYHLNEINCKVGDTVNKGDIIGTVGSTGYSTGAHLHFEMRLGEYAVNPWTLFDGTSDIYRFAGN